MINKISVIKTKNTNPYRNLAIEEYLTLHSDIGECVLFLWQNEKSVVIGKNQNAYAECDTERLEAEGGHLVRRLSGGGAVFHDLGNLNFTFCVRDADYDISRQCDVILEAVKELGIKATRTGRNDLTVDGKKFSGHAFYKKGDKCCHHGTILMNIDTALLTRYLTPDRDKLTFKGVRSVSARVCNLSDFIPGINADIISESLIRAFSKVYGLPVSEIPEGYLPEQEIKKKELSFASKNFIYGKNVSFSHRIKCRNSWGGAEILLCVTDGFITDLKVYSDCMDEELPVIISHLLKGSRYSLNEISERLRKGIEKYRFCCYHSDIKVIFEDIIRIFGEKMR